MREPDVPDDEGTVVAPFAVDDAAWEEWSEGVRSVGRMILSTRSGRDC